MSTARWIVAACAAVSEALADLAKRSTLEHVVIAADQVDEDGLPSAVVAIERAHWPNPQMAERDLGKLRPRVQQFAAAWTRYEERKALVDAAIAEAAELEKSGKLEEAEQRLAQVLTVPDRDARGELPQRSRVLEATDAEYPVLEAIARVAAKRKDYATAVDAVALMQIRQQALPQQDERVLWALDGLTDSRLSWEWFKSLEKYLRNPKSRRNDAVTHYLGLGEYGLHPISLSQDKTVKAGDWVHFRMSPQTITEKEASWKHHYEGLASYDCKQTDRLASYDRSNGQFHYYESCKQKKVVEDQSVSVKFKSPPPAWASGGRDVPVVGRLVKAGPHWVVEDAFVCDRWLGGLAPIEGASGR